MSQENLIINENSHITKDIAEQNNSDINNDILEREKKFKKINGIKDNIHIQENNSQNESESVIDREIKNSDLDKNVINYKEKNSSGLFLSKFNNRLSNLLEKITTIFI